MSMFCLVVELARRGSVSDGPNRVSYIFVSTFSILVVPVVLVGQFFLFRYSSLSFEVVSGFIPVWAKL